MKLHDWVLSPQVCFFIFGFGLYEADTKKRVLGLPGPVTSHCDILTNWIRMFKVSVVSGAACTGAQVHTATCWVTEQLQTLLTGCAF